MARLRRRPLAHEESHRQPPLLIKPAIKKGAPGGDWVCLYVPTFKPTSLNADPKMDT